jgi:hypothetical protein
LWPATTKYGPSHKTHKDGVNTRSKKLRDLRASVVKTILKFSN